jgi:hypothetical protein
MSELSDRVIPPVHCMGFRRRTLQDALGVPLIVANLLVARGVGEILGG